MKLIVAVAAVLALSHAHEEDEQVPIEGPIESVWYNTLPGDGGKQADSVFSGISTFGRLDYFPCLASDKLKYDIAFIGQSRTTSLAASSN